MIFKIFKTLFFCFALLFAIAFYYGVKFRNPYKLYFIFGKKGSGKSTTMTKLAYDYGNKGYQVFCTDDSIGNTFTFDPKYFGNHQFPERSVVLIDEVSLIWSNRDFKSFGKDIEKQFRFQRKDRLIIYLFSQTFDVDKKIRDLADAMYLAEKKLNCIVWLKKIAKNPTITEADSRGESRVTENLQFEPLIFFWLGSRKMVWLPKWVNRFDSFSTFGWERDPMPATYTYDLIEKPRLQLSPPSFDCRSALTRLKKVRLPFFRRKNSTSANKL